MTLRKQGALNAQMLSLGCCLPPHIEIPGYGPDGCTAYNRLEVTLGCSAFHFLILHWRHWISLVRRNSNAHVNIPFLNLSLIVSGFVVSEILVLNAWLD